MFILFFCILTKNISQNKTWKMKMQFVFEVINVKWKSSRCIRSEEIIKGKALYLDRTDQDKGSPDHPDHDKTTDFIVSYSE